MVECVLRLKEFWQLLSQPWPLCLNLPACLTEPCNTVLWWCTNVMILWCNNTPKLNSSTKRQCFQWICSRVVDLVLSNTGPVDRPQTSFHLFFLELPQTHWKNKFWDHGQYFSFYSVSFLQSTLCLYVWSKQTKPSPSQVCAHFIFLSSESIICKKLPYKYNYYVWETIND